jgi:hypothetical protein
LVVKIRAASDGTIRSTVTYGMRAEEWAGAKVQPDYRLDQHQ